MNNDGKSELSTNQAILCHALAMIININNRPYTGDVNTDTNKVNNRLVSAGSLAYLLMAYDPILSGM